MTRSLKKATPKAPASAMREQKIENSRKWHDHELALLKVKELFGDDAAYHKWYNAHYDALRFKDYEAYKQGIFDKLSELSFVTDNELAPSPTELRSDLI